MGNSNAKMCQHAMPKKSPKNATNKYLTILRVCWSESHKSNDMNNESKKFDNNLTNDHNYYGYDIYIYIIIKTKKHDIDVIVAEHWGC